MDLVTNVTWFVWKIRDHPIGRGKYLPGYIVDNVGITPLDRNIQRGKPYKDHLCFFRCLALHNGCHTKNLKRDTQYYYQQYQDAGLGKKKFHGVKMSELDDLEKLYEVNIQVYSLAPTHNHGKDEDSEENTPDFAAILLRRSHRHFSSTLYLNLYENHFSYIKDLARYSKSFCCSRCGKYWKDMWKCQRHEKTCDGKVQLNYPGGAYHVPKTIFEELEDECIVVPEEWRYFPYRATFGFECYFDKGKAQELKNTETLTWQSAHVPLSVSICSNVPGYQASKCFVSEGDSDLLLEEFVQYLTTISTKRSSLLRQRYAEVFEALESARGQNNSESYEDRLAQILVDIQEGSQNYNEVDSEEEEHSEEESEDDSRGIDLRASDDEKDEEEIEAENEEDRAFIDDEPSDENDPSFYRRLNVEVDRERRQQLRQTRDQLEELQDIVGGSEDVSDHKVLSQLEEKLNAYIQELPVLGSNSGKYDLNASKEFLFPYLIKHQPIKITVKRNNNHMCIKTDSLKFLDISNYLAPGFSYDQFLKAYECEQTKGFFPYQWVDKLDKLNETSLPPHAAFYSSLKNANITGEEYRYCQQVWEDNEMSTFKDFLVWYYNLDVVPFLEAVEKMNQFWQERKIDTVFSRLNAGPRLNAGLV